MIDRPLSQFGGRRFLLCLGCGIACTGLVFFGKIDDTIFRDIIIATIGAYIAGNTIQKVKGSPEQPQ